MLSGASGLGQQKNPPSARAGRPERATTTTLGTMTDSKNRVTIESASAQSNLQLKRQEHKRKVQNTKTPKRTAEPEKQNKTHGKIMKMPRKVENAEKPKTSEKRQQTLKVETQKSPKCSNSARKPEKSKNRKPRKSEKCKTTRSVEHFWPFLTFRLPFRLSAYGNHTPACAPSMITMGAVGGGGLRRTFCRG